eukprot:44414-Eustigmatos_ZCMA.PRE.1
MAPVEAHPTVDVSGQMHSAHGARSALSSADRGLPDVKKVADAWSVFKECEPRVRTAGSVYGAFSATG